MPLTPDERADRDMTEAELSRAFDALRRRHRWLGFRPRSGSERRSRMAGTQQGIPDWVLARPPRLLFVELKRERERGDHASLSPLQQVWAEALAKCPGVEYRVVRPSNLRLGDAEEWLR